MSRREAAIKASKLLQESRDGPWELWCGGKHRFTVDVDEGEPPHCDVCYVMACLCCGKTIKSPEACPSCHKPLEWPAAPYKFSLCFCSNVCRRAVEDSSGAMGYDL